MRWRVAWNAAVKQRWQFVVWTVTRDLLFYEGENPHIFGTCSCCERVPRGDLEATSKRSSEMKVINKEDSHRNTPWLHERITTFLSAPHNFFVCNSQTRHYNGLEEFTLSGRSLCFVWLFI